MPSLARAFECLMSRTPQPRGRRQGAQSAAAATRAAAATTARGGAPRQVREAARQSGGVAGRGAGPRRRARVRLPTMLHRLCEALCKKADEARRASARGLREHGVTPQTATCVLVAGACGRRHAAPSSPTSSRC